MPTLKKKVPSTPREPSMINSVQKNWKSMAIIGAIIATSIFGWTFAMGQVKQVAQDAVDQKVNKAMIDGAKEAAAKSVAEQLPAISKQVAQDTVREMMVQQKAEEDRKEVTKKGKTK